MSGPGDPATIPSTSVTGTLIATRMAPTLPVTAPSMVVLASEPSAAVTANPPANVTFLPGEDVLLLSVPLPAMSAAQRRAAIGFAVEDHLAQALDQAHVALGPQIFPGRWLVAVVSYDVLAKIAVPQGHRLVPDTLAVPVPDAGWAVSGHPGRVLVRLPDGTGFATDAGTTVQLWHMAGSPEILSYGGPLPQELPVAGTRTLPAALDASLMQFDLMIGNRAGRTFRAPPGIGLALGVLAAFLTGHMLISAIDMIALTRIEAARADQLRAALAAAGQPAGADLTDSLTRALAGQGEPERAGFLELAPRIFSAIADHSGQVSLGDLRYDAAQDSLVMTLEAADLETLQQIENSLVADGLSVQAGAATTGGGGAEMQMTVGGGGT